MFEITVRIEAPALADAINSLAAAIAGNIELLLDRPTVTVETQVREITETGTQETTEPPKETPGNNEVIIPTIVELREVAHKKGTTPEGKQAVKSLLEKYESKSISNVPEDKRAAFMKELEALDGK